MLFCQLLFINAEFYFIWIGMVFFSIWIHECAHSLAAYSQGDDTALRNGCLYPNPLKLMGIPAIIALFLVGITWGSVPVNYMKLKKGRMAPMLVALSGPVANFILYIIFSIAGTFVFKALNGDVNSIWMQMMVIGAVLNIVLFVINLLPVPPLDGWIVSICLFPGIVRMNQEFRNGMIFAIFALAFMSFSYFYTYGQYAVVYTMKLFAVFFGI